MPFSHEDWVVFELASESPRVALVEFLNRLERSSESLGWARLDQKVFDEDEFSALLGSAHVLLQGSCFVTDRAIDRFVCRAEHTLGHMLAGDLSHAWKKLSAGLINWDWKEDVEPFLDGMDVTERWFDGSLEADFDEDDELGEQAHLALRDERRIKVLAKLVDPAGADMASSTGAQPLLQVLRWWPHFRKSMQERSFVPVQDIRDLCLAVETYAKRLMSAGLAVTARRRLAGKAEVPEFAEFRRSTGERPIQPIESISHITSELDAIRSMIASPDRHRLDEDEILERLFDVLLEVRALGRPHRKGGLSQSLQGKQSRAMMRKLAPAHWRKGISGAAWARAIADDPMMQRISERHGGKRKSSMSWRTIQGYLAEDFDLSDGGKRHG